MGRGKVVSEKRLAESAESLEGVEGSVVLRRSRLVGYKTFKAGGGVCDRVCSTNSSFVG